MDLTQVTPFNTEAEELTLDANTLAISDFYHQLSEMVEYRIYTDKFVEIVNYLSNWDKTTIAYLEDKEMDRQLIFCSQWTFTLRQIATELKLYENRIARRYKQWWATKFNAARAELLEAQQKEVTNKFRTKSNFGLLTKDDLTNYILEQHAYDNEAWQVSIERINRMYLFFNNLLEDLKQRSMILMSLRKERSQF
jgi:hypothetical protein